MFIGRSEEWILDYARSFHMTPYSDWFTCLDDTIGGTVLDGNNNGCKVRQIGTIKLEMSHVSIEYLHDVR